MTARSSNRKRLIGGRAAWLLPVAVLAGADIASATALVVRSSGPSAPNYRPGKALPDNAQVSLRPGDVLTVLASDSTRTLHGPGTFALASAGGDSRLSIMAGRRGRFSALRTAGIVPRSPTIWHVDVSQSGKACLADPKSVQLWRSSAAKSTTLTITRAGAAPQTAEWPAGQATLAWPEQVPIAPGAEYQVAVTGEKPPAKVTFATLPSVPTDLSSVAKALIEQHCDNQLNLLIETLPTAGGPAS